MKIHSAIFGTLAAATAMAALSVPTAQAEGGIGIPQASTSTMADEIRHLMKGKAFGYQFAIAQDGLLKVQDAKGTAISEADNFGIRVPMASDMKMELAGVTQNITAVATLKVVRAHNLTIDHKVWPYLPDAWDRSEFSDVSFRDLLTHTSGVAQSIKQMPDYLKPKNNGWRAMKTLVQYGATPADDRKDKAANYALLRIIVAEMWLQKSGYEGVQITKDNHTNFTLDYMRKAIFQPADLDGVGCITGKYKGAVRSYARNADQGSSGKVLGTVKGECAGARGIALSSVQLLQYLAHLRHGSIIVDADLATMDSLRAGWAENSNGYDGNEDGEPDNAISTGAFWQAGDLSGAKELHTCAVTFNDGTEATLLVNSKLDKGAKKPCTVLIKAWREAI